MTARICCLGDSITHGVNSTSARHQAGYRWILLESLLANGYAVEMVGSLVDDGGGHEGHDGWMLSDMLGAVPRIARDYDPAIWLVLGGTNDLIGSASTSATRANAPSSLATLLGAIRAYAPLSQTIVSNVPPVTNGLYSAFSSAVSSYQAAISSVAAGAGAVYVEGGLAPADLSDGVHPNDGGYDKLAVAFYQPIKTRMDTPMLLLGEIAVTVGGAVYSAVNVPLWRQS